MHRATWRKKKHKNTNTNMFYLQNNLINAIFFNSDVIHVTNGRPVFFVRQIEIRHTIYLHSCFCVFFGFFLLFHHLTHYQALIWHVTHTPHFTVATVQTSNDLNKWPDGDFTFEWRHTCFQPGTMLQSCHSKMDSCWRLVPESHICQQLSTKQLGTNKSLLCA